MWSIFRKFGRKKADDVDNYFPFPTRKSPYILKKNEREKYYKKYTNKEITEMDYIYGGLVDMIELWYGKEIDEMIRMDKEKDNEK
jgi:hypothetical protein